MSKFQRRAVAPALHFKFALSKRLKRYNVDKKRGGLVTGVISHQGGESEIQISDLGSPLSVAPSVNCIEPWVRRAASWHYELHSQGFCWVLREQWVEYFKGRLESGHKVDELCRDSVVWLLEAMRIVLSRHWIGHHTGIYEWPQEWEDYSHGEEGVIEYRKGEYRRNHE